MPGPRHDRSHPGRPHRATNGGMKSLEVAARRCSLTTLLHELEFCIEGPFGAKCLRLGCLVVLEVAE